MHFRVVPPPAIEFPRCETKKGDYLSHKTSEKVPLIGGNLQGLTLQRSSLQIRVIPSSTDIVYLLVEQKASSHSPQFKLKCFSFWSLSQVKLIFCRAAAVT